MALGAASPQAPSDRTSPSNIPSPCFLADGGLRLPRAIPSMLSLARYASRAFQSHLPTSAPVFVAVIHPPQWYTWSTAFPSPRLLSARKRRWHILASYRPLLPQSSYLPVDWGTIAMSLECCATLSEYDVSDQLRKKHSQGAVLYQKPERRSKF